MNQAINYTISARPIQWENDGQFADGIEATINDLDYGFYISYDPSESADSRYYAAWGEGAEGSFPTPEEAKSWCQDLIDAFIKKTAVITFQGELFPVQHFRIKHADGTRWRTLDSLGLPDWTEDADKALTFTLREHADAYSADDPDDVRIEECAF